MGGKSRNINFHSDASKYIENILPIEVASFPGLSFTNISYKTSPYYGLTVKEYLQKFNSKFSAVIFGVNSPSIFYKSETEIFQSYTNLFKDLYKDTKFEFIFLSTVFPQRKDLYNEPLFKGKSNFNQYLNTYSGTPTFDVEVKDSDGGSHVIKIVTVNMTEILPPLKMNESHFYCKDNADGVHFNARYLELYLFKLKDIYSATMDSLVEVNSRKERYRKHRAHRKSRVLSSEELISKFGNIEI